MRKKIEGLEYHAHLSQNFLGLYFIGVDDFSILFFREIIAVDKNGSSLDRFKVIQAAEEVLLPAPDGPMMEMTSPFSRLILTL